MSIHTVPKRGAILLPCICGLDPIEGVFLADRPDGYFIHCPDCDVWAYGKDNGAVRTAWAAQVNGQRARLDLPRVSL